MLQEIVATQAFEARVDDYVLLHRLWQAAASAADDPGYQHGSASMRELALRIQLARANAVQGDLIAPDVGGYSDGASSPALTAGAVGRDPR